MTVAPLIFGAILARPLRCRVLEHKSVLVVATMGTNAVSVGLGLAEHACSDRRPKRLHLYEIRAYAKEERLPTFKRGALRALDVHLLF